MCIQLMDQTPHNKVHRNRERKHPLIINDLIFLLPHENIAADQIHICRADTLIILSSFIASKHLTEFLCPVIRNFPGCKKLLIEPLQQLFDLIHIPFIRKLSNLLMKSFPVKKWINNFSLFCFTGKILISVRAHAFCSKLLQFFHKPFCLRDHSLFFCPGLTIPADNPCQQTKSLFPSLVQLHIKNLFLFLNF